MVKSISVEPPNISLSFRSSYIITVVFMLMTAAVLAEICSALPLSGSIYIWAAQAAGPKYARFIGFVVSFWTATAWMTSAAGASQVRAVIYDLRKLSQDLLCISK